MELRQKYSLSEGSEVEFIDMQDGIKVRPTAPFCRICGAAVPDDAQLPLCERCLAAAARSHNAQ